MRKIFCFLVVISLGVSTVHAGRVSKFCKGLCCFSSQSTDDSELEACESWVKPKETISKPGDPSDDPATADVESKLSELTLEPLSCPVQHDDLSPSVASCPATLTVVAVDSPSTRLPMFPVEQHGLSVAAAKALLETDQKKIYEWMVEGLQKTPVSYTSIVSSVTSREVYGIGHPDIIDAIFKKKGSCLYKNKRDAEPLKQLAGENSILVGSESDPGYSEERKRAIKYLNDRALKPVLPVYQFFTQQAVEALFTAVDHTESSKILSRLHNQILVFHLMGIQLSDKEADILVDTFEPLVPDLASMIGSPSYQVLPDRFGINGFYQYLSPAGDKVKRGRTAAKNQVKSLITKALNTGVIQNENDYIGEYQGGEFFRDVIKSYPLKNEKQIRDEHINSMMGILVPSNDTLKAALFYLLTELAHDRQIQSDIREEVEWKASQDFSQGVFVSAEKFKAGEMPQLWSFVTQMLAKYPSLPITGRDLASDLHFEITTGDTTDIESLQPNTSYQLTLPKGTSLAFPLACLHSSTQSPCAWADSRNKETTRYTFLDFSSHRCPGQTHVKQLLAMLVAMIVHKTPEFSTTAPRPLEYSYMGTVQIETPVEFVLKR